jgi:hypothetical protein
MTTPEPEIAVGTVAVSDDGDASHALRRIVATNP